MSRRESTFWPMGDRVHFERVTKQRYGLGPVREDLVESGLNEFASSAAILERRLDAADWLVGHNVTYADFRIACVLPFADLAGLPPGVVIKLRRLLCVEVGQ
jgi:glutathione S-transferase